MNKNKPGTRLCRTLATLTVLPFISCILMQCSNTMPQELSWHYIVPDAYQGFLAIRYNCPDGNPLLRQGDIITVRFAPDGTFCTNEKMVVTRGRLPTAESYSGKPVPFTIKPREYQGYAVCCGHSQRIAGNTAENSGSDLLLDLLWVGTLHPRPPSEPEVPDDFDRFLQDRFGVRDIH